MDRNDELTIGARSKGWEIFSPQWDYLAEIPALELGSICAMSVGLHPYFASPAWVLLVAMPHFDGTDSDEWYPLEDAKKGAERAKRLKEFLKRAHVACANLAPLGHLPIAAGEPNSEKTVVRVADFAVWAASRGWELPAEFPKPEPVLARADAELGPEEAAGSDKDLVNPPVRPKRQKQADRIKACLAECERRAAEKGLVFDLQNMPGAKADLLDFLHTKDGDNLGSIKGVSSLDRYLKGVCKWSNSAHANPPATPLYAQLFPELKWAPRAVLKKPTQQRKA